MEGQESLTLRPDRLIKIAQKIAPFNFRVLLFVHFAGRDCYGAEVEQAYYTRIARVQSLKSAETRGSGAWQDDKVHGLIGPGMLRSGVPIREISCLICLTTLDHFPSLGK